MPTNRLCKRRKNRDLFLAFAALVAFSIVSTVIMMVVVHHYDPDNTPAVQNLSDARLRYLMSESRLDKIQHPLHELILEEGMLNFFHLPKRKVSVRYNEATTANRDTSYPLAPDFSFHIDYVKTHVVIYKDLGPGCLYRMYLLPDLPTEAHAAHALTFADLATMRLVLDLDGEVTEVTLKDLHEGGNGLFLQPLSSPHAHPTSGIGTYTPLCYQQSAEVRYYPGKELPKDLFLQMVNCSRNDFLCPAKIYSAVSSHSFVHGTKVPKPASPPSAVRDASALLSRPELYGPGRPTPCALSCRPLSPGGTTTLLHRPPGADPGVISVLRVRLLNKVYQRAKPSDNWSDVLITMHFDSSPSPQIDRVPLGALFMAQGSADNDFMGAALGRRISKCSYTDNDSDRFPELAMTGYIYFPMPYWESVSITAQSTSGKHTSTVLCYQIITVKNYYDRKSTGYFHAHKTYYTDDTAGWRNVLKLDNTWGHIVGLLMEVDNVRARRNVPVNERWSVLQADMVLYLDGSTSASVLGTGLEDYFSYAHGFALAENTSYSFVGVPFTAPRRKEPLSWHCYRLHVLDPIPFHNSVHFIAEGTDADKFHEPARPLRFKDYHQRRSESRGSLSHTVLYYAQSSPGMSLEDTLNIGDPESEPNHKLQVHIGPENMGTDLKRNPSVTSRFIGDVIHNITYSKLLRDFSSSSSSSYIRFTLKVKPDLQKRTQVLLLRREHYIPPKTSWNQFLELEVNGVHYDNWFTPFGSVVEEYVFKHEDIMIKVTDDFPVDNEGNTVLNIKIDGRSPWYDSAYYLYKIL